MSREAFTHLLTSDRLNKDAEALMNSSFWLDQLKCSKAKGLGNIFCSNKDNKNNNN